MEMLDQMVPQDNKDQLESKEQKVNPVCEDDQEFLDSLVELEVWEQKDVLADRGVTDDQELQVRREPQELLDHKVLLEHLVAMELEVKKAHQEPVEMLGQKEFQEQKDSRVPLELVDTLVQLDSQENEGYQERKGKRQ